MDRAARPAQSESGKRPIAGVSGRASVCSPSGGHQESWADAFRNLIRDAYQWIREDGRPEAKPAPLPTFEDGYRSTCLVETMLEAMRRGDDGNRYSDN